MPRVESFSPLDATPPPRRNTRSKKPAPPQDRLSQRALFFRRVRKSLKPGLWILGVGAVFVVGSELFRSLPVLPSSAPVSTPAPAPTAHHRFGLATLAAYMGLRISRIDVTGADSLDPAALDAAIGVKVGDPALGFSLEALQDRVAQLGPVQSVTVERVLPGTLVINITARDALAIWQTGGQGGEPQFVLIDKQGNVIASQDAAAAKRREPSLLLLSGADAPQFAATLLAELKTVPVVLAHVAAAQRVDGLRWNLILKDQTVVKLPSDNEATAIGQLAALQNGMQLLDRPVEDIDLRQSGRLVVRPYAPPAPPADAKVTPGKKAQAKKTEPTHE
jgi:cell division protein FtsQ